MKGVINKKNIIIGLVLIFLLMAIGYASFTQLLTINGTSSVNSSWNVHIKSIVVSSSSAGGTSTEANVSEDGYSANFNVSLSSPGDYVTYTVTVENTGTINAMVGDAGITFSGIDQMDLYNDQDANNPNGKATSAIVFTYDEIAVGDKLPYASDRNTDTFLVTAMYNPNYTSQPDASELSSNVRMTLNYVQDQ